MSIEVDKFIKNLVFVGPKRDHLGGQEVEILYNDEPAIFVIQDLYFRGLRFDSEKNPLLPITLYEIKQGTDYKKPEFCEKFVSILLSVFNEAKKFCLSNKDLFDCNHSDQEISNLSFDLGFLEFFFNDGQSEERGHLCPTFMFLVPEDAIIYFQGDKFSKKYLSRLYKKEGKVNADFKMRIRSSNDRIFMCIDLVKATLHS